MFTREKSDVSLQKVLSIRRVLLAQYSSFSISGLDLLDDYLSTLAVLPTGCNKLDDILTSGIYTGEVTEVIGISSSGKSQVICSVVQSVKGCLMYGYYLYVLQFCQSFTINVAAILEQNVIYIDTSGGSSITRLSELCHFRCDSFLLLLLMLFVLEWSLLNYWSAKRVDSESNLFCINLKWLSCVYCCSYTLQCLQYKCYSQFDSCYNL